MARKASYQETVDFDETDEILIDQATVIALRRKRRRPVPQDPEAAKPAAAILPIYLREMGSTPLIDENQEVELARELQEAREGMAKVAMKIPAAVRPFLLEDGLRRGALDQDGIGVEVQTHGRSIPRRRAADEGNAAV